MEGLEIISTEEETTTAPEVVQNPKELALSYLKSMGLNIPEQFQTQFIEIAAAMKLNPFLNEIHAISYNTKEGPVFKCVTGYMVYIKRAERSGKLNGWEVSSQNVGGQMVSTVTIYRKDWEKPFRHSVRFNEVAQWGADGQLSNSFRKSSTAPDPVPWKLIHVIILILYLEFKSDCRCRSSGKQCQRQQYPRRYGLQAAAWMSRIVRH